MRIRNGFVSNSSSSSFIVSNKNFASVRELAKYMLNRQIKDHDFDGEYAAEYIEYDRQYIERLEKIDENQSVSFPSCNYDTYIRRVGDCYLVNTCNNTDWKLEKFETRLTENAKEELRRLRDSYSRESDEFEAIAEILRGNDYEFWRFGKDFYDLRAEIIGIERYEKCPNKDRPDHVGAAANLWDTPKYGKICLVCSPYFQRKDKLEQINNFKEE